MCSKSNEVVNLFGKNFILFVYIYLKRCFFEVLSYDQILIYIYIRAFGGATLAHLQARHLWRSITIHDFAARFARCAFGTPKDNGVDASIDIFLVASLEYHLI